MTGLDAFFRPRSVAVVGASRRRGAVGRRILESLIAADFAGPVYAINPDADHVGPHPCHASLAAVGARVDLAVVAVPAEAVADVVSEAVDHGVKGLIVVSAGFAEAGEEQRQRDLLERLAGSGTRMIGPNCLGVVHTDPDVRLHASFAPSTPGPGSVALCSQSGALGVAVVETVRRAGLGLRSMVSIGNAADVGVRDLLAAWGDDPDVSTILLYLESFDDPRALATTAREVAAAKPIFAVKAGRTEVGSAAAASHTASLAGADTAADELLRDAGIVRVDTLQGMLDAARFCEAQDPPPGPRLCVVTNSGGPGILVADAASNAGFDVAEASEGLRGRLARALPSTAATANPIDMLASATTDRYREVVGEVVASGEYDAIVVVYTEIEVADLDELGAAVAAATADARCAVLAVVIGSADAPAGLGDGERRIPVYRTPAAAVAALAAARERRELLARETGALVEPAGADVAACRAVIAEQGGDGWLGAVGSRRLLEAAGIRVAPFRVATCRSEAETAAHELDEPLSMSVISPDVLHKTEHGGVELHLDGPAATAAAFARIERRMAEGGHAFEGVVVAEMQTGTEVLIGAQRKGEFGPLLTFGLGGVLVELLGDVACRLVPPGEAAVRRMIEEIRGYPLLTGYRGRDPAAIDDLVDALLRAAWLADRLPEIAEFDLNPVFAGPTATVVADARVRIDGTGG